MKIKIYLKAIALAGLLPIASNATVIAQTGASGAGGEFSGTQGQDGWSYGYWDVTSDGSPSAYDHTTDFTAFPGGSASGVWSDTNHWTGSAWDFNPVGAGTGNPPWTVITPTSMHPNDESPGNEHYPVLRYTVEDGPGSTLTVTGFFNNVNANGDGTTGRIILNGVEQYSVVTDGTTDNLGGGLVINGVSTGDILDFMVDVGPAPGATADGNDGTNYSFTIDRSLAVPEPGSAMLAFVGLLLGMRRRR